MKETESLCPFRVGDRVIVASNRATAWDGHPGVVVISTPAAVWVRIDQSGTPVMFLPSELVMDDPSPHVHDDPSWSPESAARFGVVS